MIRLIISALFVLIIILTAVFFVSNNHTIPVMQSSPAIPGTTITQDTEQVPQHPMAIAALRERTYPGSELVIEETLQRGTNYHRFIASYTSDGLKIYGLLTAPAAPPPQSGYPVIVFLHGYIAPSQYVTTNDYVATQDGLARSGFITFKPDLRGHGRSEGHATGAHFSESYVVDTLNAIAALKQYDQANPDRIGIWGHSNGGEIGLRTMVISNEVKAGVFWAGVVGSFEDMLEIYNAQIPFLQRTSDLERQYGKPSTNPEFWHTIDPYAYLSDISGPIQLHHGTADAQVPVELSRHLHEALQDAGKTSEIYDYPRADHNLNGGAFSAAMQRTVAFFRQHLKE